MFRSGNSFTYVIHCRSPCRGPRCAVHQQLHLHLVYFWCRSFIHTNSFLEPQSSQGMSKDCLVQPFVWKAALMRLSSTLSNCKNNPSGYGASLMFLGRLFQWMIDLTAENFFLTLRCKVPSNLCQEFLTNSHSSSALIFPFLRTADLMSL